MHTSCLLITSTRRMGRVKLLALSYAQPSTSNNDLNFLLYLGSMTAMSDQNIEGTYFALKQSMDTGASICVSCNSN
jgi:hypothetical protein